MSLSDEEIRRLVSAIEATLGHRIDDRRPAVIDAIVRRAAHRGEAARDYIARIERGDPEELRVLGTRLSVGETYFFRHLEQFLAYAEALRTIGSARGRIRVRSAGCSTGEEAYTLAMVARERAPEVCVAVEGVDINREALAIARRAVYGRWSLRATSAEQEAHWFLRRGNEATVAPAIRDVVSFVEGNLLAAATWQAPPWDIVFCRNVLMYFTPAAMTALVDLLVDAVAPGGYLFLGHAETLRDHAHDLTLCRSHGTFYYQRNATRATVRIEAQTATLQTPIVGDERWYAEIAASHRRVLDLTDARDGTPAAADELERIRALVVAERFDEAEHELRRIPTERVIGPDASLLFAVIAVQTGDLASARATCDRLLAAGDHAAMAHYLLSLCESDPDRSEDHALAALAADPTFAMASVQLAFLARRHRGRAEALPHFERALALLETERADRLEVLAGGFTRRTLVELCRSELATLGDAS